MNATERIRFAVRLSQPQLRLDTLGVGAREKLRHEIAAFLGLSSDTGNTLPGLPGLIVIPVEVGFQKRFLDIIHTGEDFQHLKQLQEDLRNFFRAVIKAGMTGGPTPAVSDHARWEFATAKDIPVPVIKGNVRDTFLFTLSFLLLHEGIDRIRECPECHKIFYRVRRQIRCSAACTNRVLVRAFRERQKSRRRRDHKTRARHRARRSRNR